MGLKKKTGLTIKISPLKSFTLLCWYFNSNGHHVHWQVCGVRFVSFCVLYKVQGGKQEFGSSVTFVYMLRLIVWSN